MRVTLLLADAAQAVSGKLYILGGGWRICGPNPTAMAIALKIDVPWDQANMKHGLQVALLDEDGKPFMVPTPTGDREFELTGEFEAGRPPGLKPGTELSVTLAINIPPLPLRPDTGYVWQCSIDRQTKEEWRLPFTTRPTQQPQST